RAGEARADADVDHRRRADAGVLLGEQELLERGGAAAAVLLRPVQPGPAPVVELPLPAAPEGDLLRRVLGLAIVRRPPALGQIGDQPVVDLSPEALLPTRGPHIHPLPLSRTP